MKLTAKQREHDKEIREDILNILPSDIDISIQITPRKYGGGLTVEINIYDPDISISRTQFRKIGKYCKERHWDRDTTRLLDGGKEIDITGFSGV